MKKISLSITTYNRPDTTLASFINVLNDPRIGEIVISDDKSTPENYQKLSENILKLNNSKIKLFYNSENLGVYGNKKASVARATYDYVIVFDSDNIIGIDYLNVIYSNPWNKSVSFAPSFAKPIFDYRAFCGPAINKNNAKNYIGVRFFDCLLNTMNFFINKEEYLKLWVPNNGISGADSIFFNYLWFKAGNSMLVIPGLEYEHTIHDGSHYVQNATESAPLCKEVEKNISELK